MLPIQNTPKFVDCDHRNLGDIMKQCVLGKEEKNEVLQSQKQVNRKN